MRWRSTLDADPDIVNRINIGRLAELYLAGQVSFADFMRAAPEDAEDEEVAELIDLIEHERLASFQPFDGCLKSLS